MSNAKAGLVEPPATVDQEPVDQGVAATQKMKSHSLFPVSNCYISSVPTPGEIGVTIILGLAIGVAWITVRRRPRHRRKASVGGG